MPLKRQYKLSQFINCARTFLTSRNFFEHHLYSTLEYKIENTDTFKIKNNLYLRYNPEPDIWQVGKCEDRFFWIGSMFRNERKLTDIHQYEFTVLDIYLKFGSMEVVVSAFLDLLRNFESRLKLKKISELEIKYITYDKFKVFDFNSVQKNCWFIVTEYPMSESFYDLKAKKTGYSNKFEIFYVSRKGAIEIAACGLLGNNLNKSNYINERIFLNQKIKRKKFVGFGIGIERLIKVYGS